MSAPDPTAATPHAGRRTGVGFALVIAAGVLWGTSGLAGTFAAAHSHLSWAAISSLRVLGGGLIMLVVTGATGELRAIPRTADAYRHIAMTAVLAAVYQGAYFEAVALVGVAVSTVISLGAAPVAVALAAAVRQRRMPRPGVLIALIVAVVGLVLVSDDSARGVGGTETALGIVLALVAGLSFAGTTIVNRRAVPGLSASALIATSFTAAGLLLGVWGVFAGFDIGSADGAAWWWLVFLAIVPTVLSYLFFFGGLSRGVPPTTAALLSLIEPATASVLAVLVLHEALTIPASAGIVLLLLAVLLVRPRSAGEGAIAQPEDEQPS
jgi:DME family drug/metabolite transporter